MSRTRSGASSGSPHPDRGGQPKRWRRVGPPPSPAGSTHQRVPGPGESTHLVVPGMRTLSRFTCGALHRFHLVRLLGLFLGDGGGVEPGLNLEGLHRRRVEGSAFLALFLGGLSPGGAVRNSSSSSMGQFLITARTEEGTKSEKLAWSGFSQAIGSVASSLTSTEALSLRSRARSVSGPSAPADRAAVQTALTWSSTVNCQCVPAISRVAELVAVSMGSVFLPHPMHFVAPFFTQGMVQQGQIQDAGSLPRGRFSKPARLPTCCPGVLRPHARTSSWRCRRPPQRAPGPPA